MRITKNQLRQIIKEELAVALSEQGEHERAHALGHAEHESAHALGQVDPESPHDTKAEAAAEAPKDIPKPPPTATPEQKIAESRRRKVRKTRKK